MSRAPVESDNSQAELRGPSPAYALVPVWVSEVRDVVHQSLAATNTIFTAFASRRVNEGLSFSKKLGACTSIGSIVCTYVSYCRTMLEQYQAAFAHLQVISVDLAGELLRASPMPVRSTPSDREEQTARSRNAAQGSSS